MEFEQIANESFERHYERSENLPSDFFADYAHCIYEAAKEYDIEGREIVDPENCVNYNNNNNFDFQEFSSALSRLIIRLQLATARGKMGNSIQISDRARSTIRTHVQTLRDEIAKNSDLSEAKKKALNARLDDLEREIEGRRFSLLKTLAAITAVATVVNQTEGAAVRLPDTLTAISRTIGQLEGFEQRYLEHKPIAQITHQPKAEKIAPSGYGRRESFASDFDDDIPF